MLIKELIEMDNNLFDYIGFFNGLDFNSEKYWNEFILFYGNHELYGPVENIYMNDGLEGIGSIFDLKTLDWIEKQRLSDILNTPVEEINKLVETKTATGTGTDNTSRTGTDSKANNYISFDNVDSERERNTGENSETLKNERVNNDEYTLTRYETGYNSSYYNFILRTFKNHNTYRKNIYQDIVSMLCLQIY